MFYLTTVIILTDWLLTNETNLVEENAYDFSWISYLLLVLQLIQIRVAIADVVYFKQWHADYW